MLGDPPTLISKFENHGIALVNRLGFKVKPVNPSPVIRQTPWRLPHEEL